MNTAPARLRAAALLLAAAAFPLTPIAAQDTAADPAEAPAEPVTIEDIPPAPEPAETPVEAEAPAPAPAPVRTTRTTRTTTTTAVPSAPVTVVVPSAPVAVAPPTTTLPGEYGVTTAAPLPTDALPPPEVLPDTGGGTDIANVVVEEEEGGLSPLAWLLGGVLLAGVIAALLLLGRRRRRAAEVYHHEVREAPAPRPVAAAPPAADPIPVAPAAPLRESALDEPAIARTGPEVRARAAAAAPAGSGMVVSSLGLAGAGLGSSALAAAAHRQEEVHEEPAAATMPKADRPWLALFMRPVRAGITGPDAVVEFELAVTNQGSAAAHDVRVSTWMVAAGPNQESELERMLIESGADSASDLPEVTIDAGAAQKIETAVALPTADLQQESVLPVVVAEARYRLPDGSEGRTSASFAVGVPDGEELAHFAIADPTGLHEGVEARPLGEPERS